MLREIMSKDNLAMKSIIQSSLESYGLNIPGSAYYDPQLGELYEYYQAIPKAKYWVIDIDHEIVGGVGIAPYNNQEKICELQKIYIKPEYQGQGLSHQLMNAALSFATEHYNSCYLETMHQLENACILYEKYGFKLLERPLPGSDHSAMDAWYIKKLQ